MATGSTAAAAVTRIEQIEQIDREGAPAGGRSQSAVFHAIVGHLVGCGWELSVFSPTWGSIPEGIGSRYIAEGRLDG